MPDVSDGLSVVVASSCHHGHVAVEILNMINITCNTVNKCSSGLLSRDITDITSHIPGKTGSAR